ncbi:MAG: hypothetical protein KF893_24880 [Caldilineaceae bacterium]|nr:hypothetical protein [Caldilineaceae bacterium]
MDEVEIAYRTFRYELVQKWAPELSQRLHRSVEEIGEKGLNAYDFSGGEVTIEYMDAFMQFRSAFLLVNKERKEMAVFSEHSGYYEFRADTLKAEETQFHAFGNRYDPFSDDS